MDSSRPRALLGWTRQLAGVVLLSLGLMISGCVSLSPERNRGLEGHPNSSKLRTLSCDRSVAGDTRTAERHLERGRPELAKPYIDGLATCLEAQKSLRYLRAAMNVYVGVGALNPSWVHWQRAQSQAIALQDAEALAELEVWASRFRSMYTMLELPIGSPSLEVTYDGPFADEATLRQLHALRMGDGFAVSEDRIGFWLLPGRYKFEGTVEDLIPGTVFQGDERK